MDNLPGLFPNAMPLVSSKKSQFLPFLISFGPEDRLESVSQVLVGITASNNSIRVFYLISNKSEIVFAVQCKTERFSLSKIFLPLPIIRSLDIRTVRLTGC
jgi:hypothetical protein